MSIWFIELVLILVSLPIIIFLYRNALYLECLIEIISRGGLKSEELDYFLNKYDLKTIEKAEKEYTKIRRNGQV